MLIDHFPILSRISFPEQIVVIEDPKDLPLNTHFVVLQTNYKPE